MNVMKKKNKFDCKNFVSHTISVGLFSILYKYNIFSLKISEQIATGNVLSDDEILKREPKFRNKQYSKTFKQV